ncbi:MAG: transposase [Prevotella sp.]|nr:transposase [Prevotella sp.]
MHHKNNCSCTTRITVDFAQKCDKSAGRKSIKKWYTKIGEFDNKAFNDIAAAMYDREDEILNYFVNRSTNASAESLNAKIKDFRAQLRVLSTRNYSSSD